MSRIHIWRVAGLAIAAVGTLSISRGGNTELATSAASSKVSPEGTAADPPAAMVLTPVERALAKPVKLKFAKTPLKDVTATISEMAGINIVLDHKSLAGAGVSLDMPITFKADGMPLGEALRRLIQLDEIAIGFDAIDDNVLVIVSDEQVRSRIVVRLYDVHDLKCGTRKADGGPRSSNDLIEIVTGCVAPPSWAEVGGTGTISSIGNRLVVSQTAPAHEQIAELLALLRAVRDQPQKIVDAGGRVGLLSGPEAKIHRLLQARQDFDFRETPLREIANTLTRRGVPAELLPKSIEDAGMSADTPISYHAKQARVEMALDAMLKEKELGYIMDHGAIVISSDAMAKEHTFVDLYPVGDLLDRDELDSTGQPDDASGQLIDLIESTVSPTGWTSAGGTGSNQPVPIVNALICSQTLAVHNEVCKFLADIRSVRRAAGITASRKPAESDDGMTTRFYPLLLPLNAPKAEGEYVTAIRNVIEPTFWTTKGAYIDSVPAAIVARCLPSVHRQIRGFLEELKVLRPAPKPTPKRPSIIPIVG